MRVVASPDSLEDQTEVGDTLSAEDFAEIRYSRYFLDKTMFVKEIFEFSEKHIALIAPRKFGKSSVMDMFYKFVEKPLSQNGTEPDNSKIRSLFKGTNIEKNGAAYFDKHFNQYPVIKFEFQRILYGSFNKFQYSFIEMIRSEFRRHEYLLSSDKLNELDKKEFRFFYYNDDSNDLDLKTAKFLLAGKRLSEMLKKHFGKRVILLVDEYDSFRSALMGRTFIGNKEQLGEIFSTLGLFLGLLIKGNHANLERSLLTGITRVGGVYTEYANNLQVLTIFETQKFSRYYGISETEVTLLAEKTVYKNDIDLMRDWYGGYCVVGSKEKLYNMYSVLNFLSTGKIDMYWGAKASVSQIWDLFKPDKYARLVEQTMSRGKTIHFERKITKEHLLALRDLTMVNSLNRNELAKNEDLFLQYLTESGFFTVIYPPNDKKYSFYGTVEVPNDEIRLGLDYLIYTSAFLQSEYALGSSSINEYLRAVNDLSGDEKSVLKLVGAVENLFAKIEINSEFSMHAVMYAILVANREQFKRIEVVARMKYNDTTSVITDLRIHRLDGTVIVMEFKYKYESSRAAVKQIMEKKYYKVEAKEKLLVGLYLSEHKRCSVSYALCDKENKITEIRDVPKKYRKGPPLSARKG